MKLKQLRKSQNLNAMELAQKAGLDLNQPLISAMESGKVLPTPHDLQAVCEALQCTPMDLFDSVEEFDLMAVERRMNADDWAVDPMPKEPPKLRIIPGRDMAFNYLPEGNPKRSAGRISDDDWREVIAELKDRGFNNVREYLMSTLIGKRSSRKRA